MNVIVFVLLFFGVAVELGCALGLVLSRNVYARLHFVGPATTIGPAAIAMAVLISEGFSQAGIKGLIIAGILVITSPILTHATARMASTTEQGASRAHAPEEDHVL